MLEVEPAQVAAVPSRELQHVATPAPISVSTSGATETASVSLAGRVHEFDGDEPIAGATLTLVRDDDSEGPPVGSVTSDDAGQFVIPLPQDVDMRVQVTAPGYRAVSVAPRRLRAGKPLSIGLRPVAELFGRVLDEATGNALAGATVAVGGRHAVSDPGGHYRLAEIIVGSPASVRVDLQGYILEKVPFMLREHRATELDLVLRRGVAVPLQVIDRETGEPLPGAEVRATRSGPVLRMTDEQGRFELTLENGFQLFLSVSAEEHASLDWTLLVDTSVMTSLRLPLAPVAWIAGLITDSEGSPVKGARLSAGFGTEVDVGLPGNVKDSVPPGVSDSDGQYRFAVIPATEALRIVVRADDFVSQRLGPFVIKTAGTTLPLDIVLQRGATIRGTARHNGEPFHTAVRWAARDVTGGTQWTDVHGTYELECVQPGEVELSLLDVMFEPVGEPVTLQVEALRIYDQDLDWNETLTTISGRVSDEVGDPLAGLSVTGWATDAEGNPRHATGSTDKAGNYSLDAVPGLLYTVRAGEGVLRQSRPDVSAGASQVDFVMGSTGVLRLALVDAFTGQALSGLGEGLWHLAWRPSGDEAFQWIRAPVDTDGFIELELEPGVVDVSVSYQKAGYVPRSVLGLTVSVDEDAEPFTVELTKGLAVRLSIAGQPDREDLAEHVVFLLHADQLGSVRDPASEPNCEPNIGVNGIGLWFKQPQLMHQLVSFGETQSAHLHGLAPGNYTIRSFPGDLVFEPSMLTVSAGSTDHAVSWALK